MQKDKNKRSSGRKGKKKRARRTLHEAAGYPFSFEASDAPKLSKRPQRQYVIRLQWRATPPISRPTILIEVKVTPLYYSRVSDSFY